MGEIEPKGDNSNTQGHYYSQKFKSVQIYIFMPIISLIIFQTETLFELQNKILPVLENVSCVIRTDLILSIMYILQSTRLKNA